MSCKHSHSSLHQSTFTHAERNLSQGNDYLTISFWNKAMTCGLCKGRGESQEKVVCK